MTNPSRLCAMFTDHFSAHHPTLNSNSNSNSTSTSTSTSKANPGSGPASTSALRRQWLAALVATPLAGRLATARAQGSGPLRVILPISAGSGVDVIARSAQPALIKAFAGQPVVIENLPGAGGISGTQALVRATPDGQTIGMLSNNHAVNPSVFRKLPYDGQKDITPITVVGGSPFVLVVNPGRIKASDARALQAELKAAPDRFNYASSGNGTVIHLAGEMFNEAVGVSIRHVPYKGTGPMVTDLIGGQVDYGVVAVGAAQNHLKSGLLRAIGVMGRNRIGSLPDLPTIAEQGFPDVDIAGWILAAGPKGLTEAQVKRLRDGIVAAFNDPQVKESFARRDDFLVLSTPEESATFLRTEQERYARLVRRANVSLD